MKNAEASEHRCPLHVAQLEPEPAAAPPLLNSPPPSTTQTVAEQQRDDQLNPAAAQKGEKGSARAVRRIYYIFPTPK